jgi:hypothetical protein
MAVYVWRDEVDSRASAFNDACAGGNEGRKESQNRARPTRPIAG